jgi:hypothetical protein
MYTAGALKAAGIPFQEADSTMMIWVDLRKYLEAPTWEAERKLWHRLADEQRVILTPGGPRTGLDDVRVHVRLCVIPQASHAIVRLVSSASRCCQEGDVVRGDGTSQIVLILRGLQHYPDCTSLTLVWCQRRRRVLPWRGARLLPLLLRVDG